MVVMSVGFLVRFSNYLKYYGDILIFMQIFDKIKTKISINKNYPRDNIIHFKCRRNAD